MVGCGIFFFNDWCGRMLWPMKFPGWVGFAAPALVLLLACPPPIARSASSEPEVSAADLPRVPPVEPKRTAETFQIRPGFRLDLVAAEPLVVDPIALSFDENGRLFVVE